MPTINDVTVATGYVVGFALDLIIRPVETIGNVLTYYAKQGSDEVAEPIRDFLLEMEILDGKITEWILSKSKDYPVLSIITNDMKYRLYNVGAISLGTLVGLTCLMAIKLGFMIFIGMVLLLQFGAVVLISASIGALIGELINLAISIYCSLDGEDINFQEVMVA